MNSQPHFDRRSVALASAIFFAVGLVVFGLAVLAVRLQALLVWLLLAIVLAIGLDPVVRRLEGRTGLRGRRLQRSQAVALVFVAAVLLTAGVVTMIGAPVAQQVTAFYGYSARYVAMTEERWQSVREFAPWLPDLAGLGTRARAWLQEDGRGGALVTRYGLDILGKLSGLVTVLLFTLFLLLQPPRLHRLLDGAIPTTRRRAVRRAFADVGEKLQQWLRAQFLLSMTVGVATFVGLLIVGMPFPHLFAVIAAIGEVFPIVGPIVSAIPAVLVGFALSTEKGLAMVVLAVVIQMLENYVLVPVIMRRIVGVPPLLTIVGLIAGFELYGVLGAVLAVPVAVTLGILVPQLVAALTAPESTDANAEAPTSRP